MTTGFRQFTFGRGDEEVGEEMREVYELESSLFTPPGGLYLHKLLFYLETVMVGEIPDDAPEVVKRLDELYTQYKYTEEGALYFPPMGFAEYGGVWFLLCSGQGPILVGCTTDQDGLDKVLAEEPWVGCQESHLFGYGGEGVRGYGRNPQKLTESEKVVLRHFFKAGGKS